MTFPNVEEKKKITSQRLSLSKKERDFSLISSSLQLTTLASTQLTSHRIAIHCRDADTQARDRGRRLGARDEVPGRRRRIVCSVAEGGRRRRRDEPRRGQQRPWPKEHAWLAHGQSLGRHVPRRRGNGEGKEGESPTFLKSKMPNLSFFLCLFFFYHGKSWSEELGVFLSFDRQSDAARA